jgi:hypothetical protein
MTTPTPVVDVNPEFRLNENDPLPVTLSMLDEDGSLSKGPLSTFWFPNRDAALEYVVSMGVYNFQIRESVS